LSLTPPNLQDKMRLTERSHLIASRRRHGRQGRSSALGDGLALTKSSFHQVAIEIRSCKVNHARMHHVILPACLDSLRLGF
jgi:hypothetical protein